MPAFTIKDFPGKLLKTLRREAEKSRRSVTQEVLRRLECSVEDRRDSRYRAVEDQVTSWSHLSGKWSSNLALEEEIDQLYKARKRGRKVTL